MNLYKLWVSPVSIECDFKESEWSVRAESQSKSESGSIDLRLMAWINLIDSLNQVRMMNQNFLLWFSIKFNWESELKVVNLCDLNESLSEGVNVKWDWTFGWFRFRVKDYDCVTYCDTDGLPWTNSHEPCWQFPTLSHKMPLTPIPAILTLWCWLPQQHPFMVTSGIS